MTRPLVDAEASARVGQAPRFVSVVALAEATSRAAVIGGTFGWLLGTAIVVASDEFERNTVFTILGVQAVIGIVLTLLASQMARRGALMPAEPLPAGVVLVPAAETRQLAMRSWLGGLIIGIVALAALTAGANQSLLGGWSAAMIALGLGQRARARAFAAREHELDKSLWVPERRSRELPRLVAGKRQPPIERG
ncbi:MAG: hypothetical protein J7513_02620 [Solirubrobacteraceae bacterium]|nr:hypothetical protein [Solirubrobacteraceae bacterium]